MSLANKIVTLINAGIIRFVSVVTLANRDFPYHDYHTVTDTDEPETYVVGTNQVNLRGSHHKLFISKSTLIYSDVACTIRLNHPTNVAIAIVANTWYEFKSNVHTVIVNAIGAGGDIYMYFEGVLPQEARSPR